MIAITPLRIGIVGVGDVLSAYMSMAGRLERQGQVRVVGASGRTDVHRARVAGYGIPWFTTDHRQLIESDEVDLVLVISSAQTHGPIVRAALNAGKHVLVEKPLASTLEEAAEIVELADRSPGYIACAPFTILSPTYQAIARHIRRGDIGEVMSARGLYGWTGPWWSDWYYREGAGAIVDFGVYNLVSLTGILGPVRRVTAATAVTLPERQIDGPEGSRRVRVEVEDNAHLLLDFGGGMLAAVSAGFTVERYRRPALELFGTAGTIQMLGDDWAPQGYEMWETAAGAWKIYPENDPFWSWTDGLRHLVQCIREDRVPLATATHAYHVLDVMTQAKASGRDGRTREIASKFTPPDFEEDLPTTERDHHAHDPRGRQPQ